MPSEWTIDTLKEHFEKILAEKDIAIKIALGDVKDWRQNANEWRGAMDDREKNFMPKTEFLIYKETTEKQFNAERDKFDKISEWKSKQEGSMKVVLWLIGIAVTILIGIAISMVTKIYL